MDCSLRSLSSRSRCESFELFIKVFGYHRCLSHAWIVPMSLANETVFGKLIVRSRTPISSRSIAREMTCGGKKNLKFAPQTVRQPELPIARNQLAGNDLSMPDYPIVKVAYTARRERTQTPFDERARPSCPSTRASRAARNRRFEAAAKRPILARGDQRGAAAVRALSCLCALVASTRSSPTASPASNFSTAA